MIEEATVPEVKADETPVEDTEKSPVETGKEEKPDSDPILESLSDDQPAKAEEKSETDEKSEPTEDTETSDDEKKTDDEATPEAEQELSPEEAQKEEARRRYEEREKVRSERQTRVTEQTQTYVDDAIDDTDQRLRAMEVQSYNQVIESTENTLISEFERVKANPDLAKFNPESELFDSKLYDKAMKDYNAGYINYDQNGNMVGLKGSLYQHLTETAELYKGAAKSGQFQQVRDQRKMKVNSDSKPAGTPKEETKDPILEVLMSE